VSKFNTGSLPLHSNPVGKIIAKLWMMIKVHVEKIFAGWITSSALAIKIFVARMLMRGLFAVATLLVYHHHHNQQHF